MTVSVTNSFSTTKTSKHKASTSSPQKQHAEQHLSGSDKAESIEMQEVQNLPFESGKLKAQHCHWSERCSDGISQMLTSRQHRHDAALQAYLTIRSAVVHCTMLNRMSAIAAPSTASGFAAAALKLVFASLILNCSFATSAWHGVRFTAYNCNGISSDNALCMHA